MTVVVIRKETVDTGTCINTETRTIFKSIQEVRLCPPSGRDLSANIFIFDFQPPGRQKIMCSNLIHPLCGLYFGSPSKQHSYLIDERATGLLRSLLILLATFNCLLLSFSWYFVHIPVGTSISLQLIIGLSVGLSSPLGEILLLMLYLCIPSCLDQSPDTTQASRYFFCMNSLQLSCSPIFLPSTAPIVFFKGKNSREFQQCSFIGLYSKENIE